MDADDKQFAVIYPKFQEQGEQDRHFLTSEFTKTLPVIRTNWMVRYYQWKTGESESETPPANWETVLKSPILDELPMSRLTFSRSLGLPTSKVPSDYFAAVAKTEVILGDEQYVLFVTYDDGIRVSLDDKVIFEDWKRGGERSKTIAISGKSGSRTLQVDYFQITGGYTLDVGLIVPDDFKEKLAKRQANAAVALLRLGRPEKVWPLLKHSPDPRVRSYLIHRLGPLGADAEAIIKHFEEEPDITIRRALLLSLGEYSEKDLSRDTRKALLPRLQDIYRTNSDAGLHAAAEWLLRQWKHEAWLKQVNEEWAKNKAHREKRLDSIRQQVKVSRAASAPGVPPLWYVNGQGQAMVVIPGPVTFVMGSPSTEADREDDETRHKKRIGRTFALAAKPVTVEQYRKIDEGYQLQAVYTRTADLPVVATSWHQAAVYCNWLSRQEGIDEDQWCYEVKDGQVTKLKANYLSRTGYRLPTEAEVEYATRAGALTSRYYGETEELLPQYAWYLKNSEEKPWPVGSRKPNDFGFFDMLGNVYTWCQERSMSYPRGRGDEPGQDKEDIDSINIQDSRVLRGGSFSDRASFVRSAFRGNDVPAYRINYLGFRPARTFTP
jgi:formylglycine-generating enzyme required for sulfatase activity